MLRAQIEQGGQLDLDDAFSHEPNVPDLRGRRNR
jgi:hypothetical protein